MCFNILFIIFTLLFLTSYCLPPYNEKQALLLVFLLTAMIVNFLCANRTGSENAKVSGNTLFLGVSVMVFLDEISI